MGAVDGSERAALGKAVSTSQFFTLAFGTIIGVGWVIYLGLWLQPAGPLGAIIGFAAGTLLVVLIGLCYAEMAAMLPVSGGEIAYTYEAFGTRASFTTGWMLGFVYTAVTSWEAIAIGVLMQDLFPSLAGPALYEAFGETVYLGPLIAGLVSMVFFTVLNYRGVRGAARFQSVLTYAFLLLCLVFIAAGFVFGSTENLQPLFVTDAQGSILPGIIAVFVTAPFFLAGFDVIPQMMEEKSDGTGARSAATMIVVALLAAGVFYALVIVSASMIGPWQTLMDYDQLPAAAAFEAAFDSSIPSRAVLIAAFIGIMTTFNAVFLGASRVIFALGRGNLIPPALGNVHSTFGSPSAAIWLVGGLGTLGVILGRGAIGPLVNVATICFGIVFALVSLGVIRLRKTRPDAERPYRVPGGVVTASAAVVASLTFAYLAFTSPYQAGEGIPLEWWVLSVGVVLGAVLWFAGRNARNRIDESERRHLILG